MCICTGTVLKALQLVAVKPYYTHFFLPIFCDAVTLSDFCFGLALRTPFTSFFFNAKLLSSFFIQVSMLN